MNKIRFILPNFLEFARNEILIKLFKEKQIIEDNVEIYSFYGTFPNAILNGGRPCFSMKNTPYKEMKAVKKFYNDKNIRITLTFTNQCLEERHLGDKYCNQILRIFHDGYNEVLIASPLLEKYIRKNYPKYKINKSITATIKDGNENYTNYNLLVIDKKNNRNFEYLKSIKNKDRIELLCDETCINNCKYTNQHYKEISLLQLKENIYDANFAKCRFGNNYMRYNSLFKRKKYSDNFIAPEDIENYFKMGFRNYKLSGRENNNFVGLNSCIEYLIKKNFIDDVFVYILERKFLELGIGN